MGRILLVEDEFLVRLTLSEALTEAGHEVIEADGGEAGSISSTKAARSTQSLLTSRCRGRRTA